MDSKRRRSLQSEREAKLVREEQEAYRAHRVTSDEFDNLMIAQPVHDLDEGEEAGED